MEISTSYKVGCIDTDSDRRVTKEFLKGLEIFMYHAGNTPITQKPVRCYVFVESERIQNCP